MSQLPFFPRLRPSLVNDIWFDVDVSYDEEAELRELEKQHQDVIWSVTQQASEVLPFGRPQTLGGAGESDDEADQDDSDESDNSHDNDEDEDEQAGVGGGVGGGGGEQGGDNGNNILPQQPNAGGGGGVPVEQL